MAHHQCFSYQPPHKLIEKLDDDSLPLFDLLVRLTLVHTLLAGTKGLFGARITAFTAMLPLSELTEKAANAARIAYVEQYLASPFFTKLERDYAPDGVAIRSAEVESFGVGPVLCLDGEIMVVTQAA